MPTASEAMAGGSQLQAALDAGLDNLSVEEKVTFTLYQRFVFSQDGSVFWVATSTTTIAGGSLHYSSDRMQNEDETYSANQVLFSSKVEVTQFNAIAPNTMWVGTWPVGDGLSIQVVFAKRGYFYDEAKVWHYQGFAVYPALSAQLVADADDLPQGPIVSNSLPIWLTLNSMAPVYPSFLVPDNIVPPYIVAHIEPAGTQALQAFPLATWPGTPVPNSGAAPFYDIGSSQLMRDEVELTLYGFTNQEALQYLWVLINASLDQNVFGWANDPVVRDAKRTQVEIAALAQKKTILIEANYYQATADALAYRLILQAFISSIELIGGSAASAQGAIIQQPQTVLASGTVTE